MRTLMTVALSGLVASGCSWRGETKFVARSTTPPAAGSDLGTKTWSVDLDAKQITFDTEAAVSLTEAQVSSVKASLASLAPASKESCDADAVERVLETQGGQTHYLEGIKSCPMSETGQFFYVESLEKVFAKLAELAPPQ